MDDNLRIQLLRALGGGGMAAGAAQAKAARPEQLNAMEESQMAPPPQMQPPPQGGMPPAQFSGYGQPGPTPDQIALRQRKLADMLRMHSARP